MSKLYYRMGAMNSGKTTMLLQTAFNYEERGMSVIIAKPSIDVKGDTFLQSRLGIEREVDWFLASGDSIHGFFTSSQKPDCILVDEAQFLTRLQVNELFEIAVLEQVPVIAYGIRSDFKTNAFPGSSRLLEVAHSLEELKTICRCGKKALFNGRKINGIFVNDGAQVAIDGVSAEYESLCGACYLEIFRRLE